MSEATPELTEEDRRLLDEARAAFASADSERALEAARVKYLGRKGGLVQQSFERVKTAPKEERRALGKSANALKREVEKALADAKAKAGGSGGEEAAPFDMTLPGRRAEL
ncbi:MAG: hypothetical protein ACYTFI_13330, partial [Planctomycetota bacterium]